MWVTNEFSHRLHSVITELEKLLIAKNKAYGNSYEVVPAMMKILYPAGIPISKYEDALLVVRVLDKLKRMAEDNDPFGESPWLDMAGYSLLRLATQAKEVSTRELHKELDTQRGIVRPNGLSPEAGS